MRRAFLACLGVVSGLIVAAPAQAQTSFVDNNVVGTRRPIGSPVFVPLPSSYRVNIQRIGAAGPFNITVQSNAGAEDVKQINVTFYTGFDCTGPEATVVPANPAGSTTAGSDPSAAGTWQLSGSQTGAFQATASSPTARVLGDTSNIFTGNATLADPSLTIRSVGVTLSIVSAPGAYQTCINSDGDGNVTDVVPEPGALALALPGLAPLGMMLRRRVKAKRA